MNARQGLRVKDEVKFNFKQFCRLSTKITINYIIFAENYPVFTTGRIIFVIVFVLIFTGGLLWAYRKDRRVTRLHFNKPYLILFSIIAFLTVLFIIVKIRKFL